MHIIVVASQKGGSGKTTLTRSLAVVAQARGNATVMLDTDPQGSLTAWFNRREAEQPSLIRVDLPDLDGAIQQLTDAGIEYLFVDTAPSVHPELKQLIARASLVVIPVRPSPDDLDAVGDTLRLIHEADKPFHFVLTQAKPRTRLQTNAILALAQHGKMAPSVIHLREDHPTTSITGQTVNEQAENTPAAQEIEGVYDYMLRQLSTGGTADVGAAVSPH